MKVQKSKNDQRAFFFFFSFFLSFFSLLETTQFCFGCNKMQISSGKSTGENHFKLRKNWETWLPHPPKNSSLCHWLTWQWPRALHGQNRLPYSLSCLEVFIFLILSCQLQHETGQFLQTFSKVFNIQLFTAIFGFSINKPSIDSAVLEITYVA